MLEQKKFKGYVIPSEVDTEKGRELVRQGYLGKRHRCFLTSDFMPECEGVACCECIACINLGDSARKRKVFEEYDRRYPTEDFMSELKPGMIIKTVHGDFFLWIGGDCKERYKLSLRTAEREFSTVALDSIATDSFSSAEVAAVFADPLPGTPAVRPSAIIALLKGEDSGFARCVWKRPEPVKEMTVDEISKALGYKVKVVGNEKADD